jgi:hypothetical protein
VCRELLNSCSLSTNAEIPVKFLTNTVLHFFQDLKICGPAWVLHNKSLLRANSKFVLSNLHFIFENLSDQSQSYSVHIQYIHRSRDDRSRGVVVFYWRCSGDCCWVILLAHTQRKHKAFRVPRSERVHCVNALGMDSGNSSFATKSCACASITFLAGIISWSVDSMPV